MSHQILMTLVLAVVIVLTHAPRPVAQIAAESGLTRDLTAFRTQFLERDASFTAETRQQAQQRLSALERDLAQRSPLAVHLELARIAALADNGHTHVVISRLADASSRIPVRVVAMGGEFYVVRSTIAHVDLLGARLQSIDGVPVERVQKEARALWGGVDLFRDQFAFILIESPEWLHAVGVTGAPTSATYTFETRDGRRLDRTLTGDAPSATRPTSPPGRTLSPSPLAAEGDAWRTLLAPDAAPWALQAFEEPFRWRTAPEIEGLVIQMRRNADAGTHRISEALAGFRRAIADHHPTHLILDFRWNGGGDLNTTRAFMQALPTLVPGRIVVLTGPLTFSAAIASLGYLEQAAPDRVLIVGEPVGDRLVFFAEGRPVELSHSRLMVAMATERHDYQNGCRLATDCHRAVVRHPIAVTSLAPDIAVGWSVDAYAAGRDPAMDAAGRAIRADHRRLTIGSSRVPPATASPR